MPPGSENEMLIDKVERLRAEALELGRQSARANAQSSSLKQKAEDLDKQLRDLLPKVSADKSDDAERLASLHADAGVDLMFVMSGGAAPASLHLQHALDDDED
jgi:hypothetical protein